MTKRPSMSQMSGWKDFKNMISNQNVSSKCYIKSSLCIKVKRGRGSILINKELKPTRKEPRQPRKHVELTINDVSPTNPFAGHQSNIDNSNYPTKVQAKCQLVGKYFV